MCNKTLSVTDFTIKNRNDMYGVYREYQTCANTIQRKMWSDRFGNTLYTRKNPMPRSHGSSTSDGGRQEGGSIPL